MATAKKTPAAEKAATPAKETKKTTAKVAAPKKETKTAEKKPAAKKTTTATKTAAPKVFLEYQGNQVSLEDILAAVKATAGKAKTIEIYVKPEDGAAYYVAGETEGKVEF